jgi:MoaA/NifB/PqqE/SkfB family radical SAM enzyme
MTKITEGLRSTHLSLTHRCTQKCQLCERWAWEDHPANQAREILSEPEIASLLKDLKKMGLEKVTLTGGEPTIRADFINIVKHSLDEGLRVGVVTNGNLLQRKLLRLEANEAVKTEQFQISVSLLGTESATHDFNAKVPGALTKAIALLDELVARGISVGIFYTILPNNFHQVVDAVHLACQHEAASIRFGFLHGYSEIYFDAEQVANLKPLIDELYKLRKKRYLASLYPGKSLPRVFLEGVLYKQLFSGDISPEDLKQGTLARAALARSEVSCQYCTHTNFIDPYGDVYPCFYAYFSNENFEQFNHLREKFVMGNIREQPIYAIWEGKRYRDFLQKVSPIQVSDPELYTVCRQCVYCVSTEYHQRMS